MLFVFPNSRINSAAMAAAVATVLFIRSSLPDLILPYHIKVRVVPAATALGFRVSAIPGIPRDQFSL